jgi:hypothetical protein
VDPSSAFIGSEFFPVGDNRAEILEINFVFPPGARTNFFRRDTPKFPEVPQRGSGIGIARLPPRSFSRVAMEASHVEVPT